VPRALFSEMNNNNQNNNNQNNNNQNNNSNNQNDEPTTTVGILKMRIRARTAMKSFADNNDVCLALFFANVGLVLFCIAGVYYLTEDWDRFAVLCVIGYLFILFGLIIPEACDTENVNNHEPTGDKEVDDVVREGQKARQWMQFWGSVFMIVGIFLGIVGSIMYSPTAVEAMTFKMVPLIDEANLIWAISFLIFPFGFGLLTYDKLMTLRSLAEVEKREKPTMFHPQMRVHLWTEVALVLFAIAGVIFVMFEGILAEAIVFALFSLGSFIKVSLFFHELFT